MLDSIQHDLCGHFWNTHTHYREALVDTGKIPMGTHMPVMSGTNTYHPQVLNPLTVCGCQVAFELYSMLNVLLESIDLVKPSTLS